MSYEASKILSWLIIPSILFVLIQAIALWCLWGKRQRLGRWLFTFSTVTILAFIVLPISKMLIRPLEQQFPLVSRLPDKIDGIVLLGSAQESGLTDVYGKPQMNEHAETMTEFIALARLHPEAKLVFSGGSGGVFRQTLSAAYVFKLFLVGQGFDTTKVIFEDQARTTYENGVFTHRIIQPKSGETWVLITSAAHMPRAVGVFRKLGWAVIPYPSSYRTAPTGTISSVSGGNFDILDAAVHEWIGIAVYRLTGRM